ncbi:MAG: PIN domain-containing protein [Flavobacteriales bacterium]
MVVLDTSVIIFYHNCSMNFDKYDLAASIMVLEELDLC